MGQRHWCGGCSPEEPSSILGGTLPRLSASLNGPHDVSSSSARYSRHVAMPHDRPKSYRANLLWAVAK